MWAGRVAYGRVPPYSSVNGGYGSLATSSWFETKDNRHTNTQEAEDGVKQLDGTIVTVDADTGYLEIDFRAEGVLPRSYLEIKCKRA